MISGKWWQRFPKPIPLRAVLVVPFVLQTVGTVALVGYLSYRSGQQAVSDLAEQLMLEVGDRTTLYLQKTLEVPHLVNQLNADAIRLGSLPGFETADTVALERFFLAQIRRFPAVGTIAIANERGGMVGSVQNNSALSVYRTEGFAAGIYSISDIQADGKPAPAEIVSRNYDARKRPWYQIPKQAGQPTWSPIYQFVGRVPLLGISAGLPFYDASGQFQGILATDIVLENLNRFLAALKVGESGQVFIVERSGLLVANSTNQPLLTPQTGELARVRAAESPDPLMRDTMSQLVQSIDLETVDSPQQIHLNLAEADRFVRVIPYRDRLGLDWLIVIVVPESDFTAQIEQNIRTTVLLCLLALAGAIASGITISRWVTARIAQLSRASRELAEGKLNPDSTHFATQELPANSPIAEVQELTQSFNQMARQLRYLFQKEVEAEATHKSEARLRKLTEASPAVVYSVIEDPVRGISRFDYLSPAAAAIHEFPIEELRQNGALISEQIHPDDREAYWQATRVSLKTMQPFCHEWRIITPSGKVKWLQANSRPERCENGEITWHGIVTDISDRKRVEEERRLAEIVLRQYERIIASTTDGIALVDTQHRYQVVNQTYLSWYNKSAAEMIGVSVAEIVGQDIFEQDILPRYLRCLAGETVERSGWFQVPALGRQFFSVTYVPYMDGNGVISGIVASLRNLTSLKQAEQELEKAAEATRRSEARFQQVAAAVPGMIYTYTQYLDGSHKFEYVSSMSRTILELEPEEILADANSVLSQIHPDDRAAHSAAVAHSANTLEPFSFVFRNITPSGQMKWLEASSRPLLCHDNITWYGILLDVSDRHEVNRMKDEFISIVTHELRTPLTSIRASLGLLASGILDDEPETARRMLEVAGQSSDRLVRLVNDILSLERLESGKIELVKQPCIASELIEQAVAAVNAIAIEADVDLAVIASPIKLHAAPDAIVQTLINLPSNAIKFSAGGFGFVVQDTGGK